MRKKKKLRHKLFPILLVCISGAFFFANCVQYKNYVKLNNEADKILNDIEKENARHKKLQAQIKSYNSDEYIEQIAREKLGYVKSDEIIFSQSQEN